jgi:hypothetical protein
VRSFVLSPKVLLARLSGHGTGPASVHSAKAANLLDGLGAGAIVASLARQSRVKDSLAESSTSMSGQGERTEAVIHPLVRKNLENKRLIR